MFCRYSRAIQCGVPTQGNLYCIVCVYVQVQEFESVNGKFSIEIPDIDALTSLKGGKGSSKPSSSAGSPAPSKPQSAAPSPAPDRTDSPRPASKAEVSPVETDGKSTEQETES